MTAWTSWVVRNAGLVLAMMALITVLAAWVAVDRFEMNSDTGSLIRQDTEWKKVHNRYVEAFPQYDLNTLIVLRGPKPNALIEVTRALASDIRARDEVFSLVFAPGASQFVSDNALLYLESETLNDTLSTLAEAQPFLTAVAEHENLHGVLSLLLDAVTVEEELPSGLEQIADAFELAVDGTAPDSTGVISWRDELFRPDKNEDYYQLIFVKGKQQFGEDLPNGLIVSQLEEAIFSFEHPFRSEVSIRMTGQIPLDHYEIVSAWESVSLAGSIALVILIAVLMLGVRSLRIIVATYLTMLCGLIWTAAWAMLTVGHYNMISIMFLVMFIGLGVDFAIHLCLKYQESLAAGDKAEALVDANRKLGPALALCGITSGIGFLAFVPTEYLGIRELGIISGGGMVIAVIVSLTLIPAFFAVVSRPGPATSLPLAPVISGLVSDHAGKTTTGTFVLSIILVAIASQASFDYSTLSLKDPDSEAMTTLREIHDEDVVTDFVLTWIAPDRHQAESMKKSLGRLDVVSEVITPADYLPGDQEEKRYLLKDGSFLMDPVFYANENTVALNDAELVALMTTLRAAIAEKTTNTEPDPLTYTSLQRISLSLERLISADPGTRERFTDLIINPVKDEIAWLRNAFEVEEVTFKDLPGDLQARLISDDGLAIVSITPEEDVVDVAALRRFTEDVRKVVPDVTGRPVLDLGIGKIVITAFHTALAIAVISIFVVLLMTLRSVIDAILVFIPLSMTALVTLSASVLTGMQLNMANIVVIPLIFGLGVDNGIHIVKRYHQLSGVAELVRSSTPKAIFLSNLTSLSTFCALSVSSHQGIYSIGVLLTVGLASLMLLTLVTLPALLATFSPPRQIS